MKTRKEKADYFLHDCGLLDELKKYGVPHMIGSYRMDMMAWNDVDIDVEHTDMSLDQLHRLTAFILERFRPTWYEAKQETDPSGKTVWFHGFETMMTGELWNFDIWFFDRETIETAERYCDTVSRNATEAQRKAIVEIKKALIDQGLYSFEQYRSVDVYQAVMEMGITGIEDFLSLYHRDRE